MARETLHPRLAPIVAAVAIVVFLLSGCTTPDPTAVPSSAAPTAAPVFASDEEALAAAEDAFEKYQAVSDSILKDSGSEPERLLSVATDELYKSELVGFKEMAAAGLHLVGRTTSDSATFQSMATVGKITDVSVYLCIDVSATDVQDAGGKSIVRSSRVDRYPVELAFQLMGGDMLLSEKAEWTGENFC